jgi:RHS repeat-associated protein
VERYRYHAYGLATVLDDDWSADADGYSDVGNPYTFTGRRSDVAVGLMQYRNRNYHTALGRFISRDSLQYLDAFNLYEYVASAPSAYPDPLGLAKKTRTWRREMRKYLPGKPVAAWVECFVTCDSSDGCHCDGDNTPFGCHHGWAWGGGSAVYGIVLFLQTIDADDCPPDCLRDVMVLGSVWKKDSENSLDD